MAASTDYHYLSYLILFVLVLYLAILLAFLVIRRYEIKSRLKDRPPAFISHGYDDSSFTFDFTTRVEEVGEALYSTYSRYVLLFVRGAACLFFFGYGIVAAGNTSPQTFNYFDGWNVLLLFLYFLASSCVSAAVIRFSPPRSRRSGSQSVDIIVPRVEWSFALRCVAVSAHLLFEVGGASSLLILFGETINVTSRAVGTLQEVNIVAIIALVCDMFLNGFRVRFDQFPAAAAWLMAYLLVIWPSVFTGSMRSWPYPLLDTSSPMCFANYLLLFLASFFSYVAWYAMFRMKQNFVFFFYGRRGLRGAMGMGHDRDREMIELVDMQSQSQRLSDRQRDSDNNNVMSFYTLPDQMTETEGDRDEDSRDRDRDRGEAETSSAKSSLPMPFRMRPGHPNPLAKPSSMHNISNNGSGNSKDGSGRGKPLLPPLPVQRRFSSFNDTDANIVAFGGL